MSMGQTATGVAALAVAGHFALNAVLPSPPPIEVHRLTYESGTVYQSRTVRPPHGQDAVAMTWVAEVMDTTTGLDVPGCQGSGANVYQAGAAEASYGLSQWVGSATCTPAVLVPGRAYILQAAWISDGKTVYYASEPIVMVPQ